MSNIRIQLLFVTDNAEYTSCLPIEGEEEMKKKMKIEN